MIQTVKKINNRFGEHGGYEITTTNDKVRSVPLDEANTDYQNILEWVAEGNTIEEAD